MKKCTTVYARMALLVVVLLFFGVPNAQAVTQGVVTENILGRNLLVYVPSVLPVEGHRSLVIVLHGGMGNAQRIESERSESALKLDAYAEKHGFVVAYLNGTPVTHFLGHDKLGWNAGGGCCGQSAENDVDDVGYITGVIDHFVTAYGVDRNRVYGIGHSNGAMMTQRMVCEAGVYAAAVSVSGPLNLDIDQCPAAQGKRVLAIHGVDDANVPMVGGQGTKGLSKAVFKSEEHSRQVYARSGASYSLDAVKRADHRLDHIDDMLRQSEGVSLGEKAVQFFGLDKP